MPLKKNTSLQSEDTQLLTIFKAHFKEKLHLSRIRLICHFITALCKVKSVNYSKLSVGFDSKASALSCFRRIQRFMAESNLSMEIVAKLIFSLLPEKNDLTLVMDRTNWKFGQSNINILMLGVSYRNVAFPLMFTMLDKRGNSNEQERIVLVEQFMEYRERWQIETLFKALKSSGFNIEDTHVTQLDRLEKLFMLTMIAFVWCYKIGDFVDRQIKPITLKKHGRRAVSIFKYGLDWLSNWLLTGFNKLNINLIHFLSCT